MREFDILCREIDNLPMEDYIGVLKLKSVKLLAELKSLSAGGIEGDIAFASFIIGSVVADGKLSEEEYAILYPMLYNFFGDGINYEDCKKIVRTSFAEKREIKSVVKDMIEIFGMLSDELKEDVITVCLLICSVDGKISLKEKVWIKQLIRS